MAKPNAAAILQLQIHKMIGFTNFMVAYMKKKNPIKKFLNDTLIYFKDLVTVKKRLQKIQNMVRYEQYKYKKTELILAQNTQHFFLSGRSINQTR